MDIEKLITDTFTAHEHDTPDSDAVLAAARQRVGQARTGLGRPLMVAGGATVLTLAAATAVVLNRPGPADEPQLTAPAVGSKAPTTTATEPATPKGLRMPYSLGWLPSGEVAYRARRINIGGTAESPDKPLYGGEYMLTVTANGQVLEVDVQQFRMMPVDEARFKSGPGKSLTINNQRAVESSVSSGPGGYELYVAHPDGGTMYVNVSAAPGSHAPAQQLIDAGRRIAENVKFPGDTTVTPTFGLRDLPNGMRVCAFDVATGFGPIVPRGPELSTSYSLGTCDVQPPVFVSTAVVNTHTGTPGQKVQGHETRYTDENGYRRVWVLDAVKGDPVAISGKVPQAELYDVANRLILPH